MSETGDQPDLARTLDDLLGYLNFSSGADDPQFLANLNVVDRSLLDAQPTSHLAAFKRALLDRLEFVSKHSPTFRNSEQARVVIELLFDHVVSAFREHHRDLLFHQTDEAIWRPFLIGRAMQALLRIGSPWDELDRLVDGALDELNDFIGHRPVPALRTTRRMEPYGHEWVAPIPLYVRGVGVACGKYEPLITKTLEILQSTPSEILRAAYFDLQLLDELCLDPRAYDFDHPVNKRANYHFGQWDPHKIDVSGHYRRFVVQQMTLDGLLERVEKTAARSKGKSGGKVVVEDRDSGELLFEAAAVLAGTILMAAGTSGSGPDAHDSTVTLANLLPRIASYRDEFYRQLVENCRGSRGERLRNEAKKNGQPLAGARQHLNHFLARRRASQLEHVQLAILFARMGYPEAARRQAAIIPVASARMICEIRCRLSTASLAAERADLEIAAASIEETHDLLHRAIECGAMVDPWSMLGFQGQFSLFPSPENSVPDHRVPQLIDLVGDIFALQARLWSEAAARDKGELEDRVSRSLAELAHWWDQFASTTVEDLESFHAAEAYVSALQVADAMKAWHQGGTSAGDIGFWREHVQKFSSPRAYGLVVDALLAKRDFVASMALLMQWLSQAETISLDQGAYSFHQLSRRWMAELSRSAETGGTANSASPSMDRGKLLQKFFDLLEANADNFWSIPQMKLEAGATAKPPLDDLQSTAPGEADVDEEDPSEDLFAAAYEEMVYRDSTSDGIEGDMLESGPPPATEYELDVESRRLSTRLEFLSTLAVLWRSAASTVLASKDAPWIGEDFLTRWLPQAEKNEADLLGLLQQVDQYQIPAPTAGRDSLLEFDRRRNVKLSLIEQIVVTTVETANAARLMRAASQHESQDLATRHLQLVLQGNEDAARKLWPEFLANLRTRSLLYVSPSKGGDPRKMIEAQRVQHTIRELLRLLPRLGMLAETCQLLQAARVMENDHPVGANAVTEFDRLFEVGYKSLVETLVSVSQDWPVSRDSAEVPPTELVDSLEQLTESLLHEWLSHSRTLRLTVLERMLDEKAWKQISQFIERYGHDLFTQPFLNLGNLRAILHGGVDAWFGKLLEDPEQEDSFRLLQELDKEIPRADAVKRLTVVLEAIVENYGEYRDYNNTTTQSDRGELLYTLLDFLRVRAQYERVAWQLKPVLLAHEILVRRGRNEAAEMWRRAVADRTSTVADSLEKRLEELPAKYGMRLPTISDRIGERFVRPLTIDRVRALVRPAMEAMRKAALSGVALPQDQDFFSVLEAECTELTAEPSGAGLEVPAWLRAVEAEVESAWQAITHPELVAETEPPLAQRPMTADDVTRQLDDWQVIE